MNISIVCSGCGASLQVPEGAAGRKAKCHCCGAALVVSANLIGEAPAHGPPPIRPPPPARRSQPPGGDRHSPHSQGPPPIPPQFEVDQGSAYFSTLLTHDGTRISQVGIDRDRPLGVVLAALYSAVNALSCLALSYFLALSADIIMADRASLGINAQQYGLVGGLLAMLALALALLQAAVCFGLFTLQKWSYRLTLIVYGVAGAVALLGLMSASPLRMLLVQQIAVAVAVIFYFSQPSLKTYFRR